VETLLLSLFSFAAGFVDAIVGGGGLIQLPALLVLLPSAQQTSLAPIFGTNKFASFCGTTFAMTQYARRIQIKWRVIAPSGIAALVFSFLGARIVSLLDPAALKPLILLLLVLTLAWTLKKKDFGSLHAPRLQPRREVILALLVGAVIGFYDGFFGPGTGSFLILVFVGLFGYDFLNASANAKIINVCTNLSAVAYFAATGNVLYEHALPMALANVAGAFLGSRMALLKGNAFIRGFFLVIVSSLILRLAFDIFR
jgi:uncharacterized protein